MMPGKLFNREELDIKSLANRKHDLDISVIKDIKEAKESLCPDIKNLKGLRTVAERIVLAKEKRSTIILMIGAHVLRSGVQAYLIDLMERGYISCVAMNGAGIIHDFEFAMIGATTESVSHYINKGQFGLWKETGILNEMINDAYEKNHSVGMGEAIGKAVEEGEFPYKDISLLARGYRLNIPVTVHVSIGYDIIHEHPNCDGAATGALSYNDFLRFAGIVQDLEQGVVMNFGSAVMGPEVFLKALSMARNVAHQQGRIIKHFASLVCDLHDLPSDISRELSKDEELYYFRPFKTMLIRTVAEGGEGFYEKGKHADTIPFLWTAINEEEKRRSMIQ